MRGGPTAGRATPVSTSSARRPPTGTAHRVGHAAALQEYIPPAFDEHRSLRGQQVPGPRRAGWRVRSTRLSPASRRRPADQAPATWCIRRRRGTSATPAMTEPGCLTAQFDDLRPPLRPPTDAHPYQPLRTRVPLKPTSGRQTTANQASARTTDQGHGGPADIVAGRRTAEPVVSECRRRAADRMYGASPLARAVPGRRRPGPTSSSLATGTCTTWLPVSRGRPRAPIHRTA